MQFMKTKTCDVNQKQVFSDHKTKTRKFMDNQRLISEKI